jgi:hypothetical protein
MIEIQVDVLCRIHVYVREPPDRHAMIFALKRLVTRVLQIFRQHGTNPVLKQHGPGHLLYD